MSRNDEDYKIGYRKPPKHSRFRKGQSGHPQGRPKGTRNFKTDVRAELKQPVTVREGGSVKTVSSQQAALTQLRAKALAGDQRALDRLLGLAERFDIEDQDDAAERALSGEDESIIERFVERRVMERNANLDPEGASSNEETEK
jgi:hypothetical protein